MPLVFYLRDDSAQAGKNNMHEAIGLISAGWCVRACVHVCVKCDLDFLLLPLRSFIVLHFTGKTMSQLDLLFVNHI